MTQETIIISDIHLGGGYKTDWIQKGSANYKQFIAKLNDLSSSANATNTTLIIAGDLFDLWLCPRDVTPPTYEQVFQQHPDVWTALKSCVGSLEKVIYMNGNHDMHVTAAELVRFDSNGKSIEFVDVYSDPNLFIMHGHQHSIFNFPYVGVDTTDDTPLGYFVTRLMAGNDFKFHAKLLLDWLKFAIEDKLFNGKSTGYNIVESMLQTLAKAAGVDISTGWLMTPNGKPLSLDYVCNRYQDLFTYWEKNAGPEFKNLFDAIETGMENSTFWADRMIKDMTQTMIVMGHTHVDRSVPEPKNKNSQKSIYLNSGTWVDGIDPSYVQITDDNGSFTTSLWQCSESKWSVIDKTTL